MPPWFGKILLWLGLFVLLGAGIFAGSIIVSDKFGSGGSSPLNPGPYPTLDATKIAQYTPTFGAGDIDNLVATIMPTPRAFLTEPEVQAMNAALQGKQKLLATDNLYASSFQTIAVSQYCRKLKIFNWGLPGSDIGAAKLIEGKWQMGVSLSDIVFTMEKGSLAAPVTGNDNAGAPTIETKYNGILVITISRFGIDGPTLLRGNEYLFNVGKPIPGYDLWQIPRTIITGKSLIDDAHVEVANMVEKLVKYETIAPNSSDANLQAMYKDFNASFTQTGDKHIYDTIMAIFAPMAEKYGYAGIESVRLVMPSAPLTIYGWMDMDGQPLISQDYPTKFADSTCISSPKPSIAEAEKLLNESK